jgi:bifunctional non-homologous end joining protein LigD
VVEVGERRFVIQQHDATRLHWDLRLEHEGVLRSWALPRGIPWSPKENRLAVATEDHGLEFLDDNLDVAGVIDADPGYGTGRLTTWDRGTYETHKWLDDEVIITLSGKRVSGKYALFAMRRGRSDSRDWLIHRMDPPVDERRVRLAFGIRPMLPAAADPPGELPGADESGWVYEPRWHGVRALVTDDTGRVVITDSNGDDISPKFPEVRRIGRAIGHRELILDGVIVPVEPTPAGAGAVRHDRRGLARRMRIRSDSGARNAAKTVPTVFMAFDVLWVDGRPINGLPWELRRRQLDDLRLDGPGWRTSPIVGDDEAWSLIDDGIGVVAKRVDSLYEVGRMTTDWLETSGRAADVVLPAADIDGGLPDRDTPRP